MVGPVDVAIAFMLAIVAFGQEKDHLRRCDDAASTGVRRMHVSVRAIVVLLTLLRLTRI
jgi:hypothetical protein